MYWTYGRVKGIMDLWTLFNGLENPYPQHYMHAHILTGMLETKSGVEIEEL